jgi:hypothetical protein
MVAVMVSLVEDSCVGKDISSMKLQDVSYQLSAVSKT